MELAPWPLRLAPWPLGLAPWPPRLAQWPPAPSKPCSRAGVSSLPPPVPPHTGHQDTPHTVCSPRPHRHLPGSVWSLQQLLRRLLPRLQLTGAAGCPSGPVSAPAVTARPAIPLLPSLSPDSYKRYKQERSWNKLQLRSTWRIPERGMIYGNTTGEERKGERGGEEKTPLPPWEPG